MVFILDVPKEFNSSVLRNGKFFAEKQMQQLSEKNPIQIFIF